MRKPMLEQMARYNRWANQRLYAACAELDDGAYKAPRPAFFGSIHRTLNHLLVGDGLWLARIEGAPPSAVALDTELHADLAPLRAAREALDERILSLVADLDEAALAAPLSYRNMAGEPFETELALVLQHVFNHQTHHRGQVHNMLSGTAVAPPSLDLIYFARTAGGEV